MGGVFVTLLVGGVRVRGLLAHFLPTGRGFCELIFGGPTRPTNADVRDSPYDARRMVVVAVVAFDHS